MAAPKDPLPTGRTPEAEKKLQRFLKDYDAFAKNVKGVSLTILIWGSDPNKTTPAAEKRKQLLKQLREDGHNALFSEELADRHPELSQKTAELGQARSADLVIILLEDSPGALGKAHDFATDPEVIDKVYILVPKKYSSGYSAAGMIRLVEGRGGVHWYEDNDLIACHVTARVLTRVNARRELEFDRLRRKKL